jgi:chromosome segregation ATPase
LEAQILDIERQQSRVKIENAKLVRRITNEQKALKDAVKEVSDELIIQEGSLTAINKELSILRAQYEAIPRDASDFQAIVFELAALTAKARNETEIYKEAIDELLRSLDQAKNPLDLLPQAGQQTKDLIDAAGEQLKILSKFAADFKKKNEDLLNIQNIKEGLVELTIIGLEFAKIAAQQQTDLLDAQVRAQETRVQRFTELAREGNVSQLQLEEERLSKLLALREQAAQRERALTALQITAANALSVAQAIQSIIAGFRSGNILAGIANSIALAATVGSTILAIKNATSQIPAFYEGTDFVKLNGAPKGRDTVIARVNEGERIVPTDLNRQVLGMSNKELINYAKLGREL